MDMEKYSIFIHIGNAIFKFQRNCGGAKLAATDDLVDKSGRVCSIEVNSEFSFCS